MGGIGVEDTESMRERGRCDVLHLCTWLWTSEEQKSQENIQHSQFLWGKRVCNLVGA